MINDCSPNTDCEYLDIRNEFNSILNIKYFKTESNSGPGVARQLGLDNCQTPWVMFHDDDDMLNNPYVIEKYLDVINAIPDNIVVPLIFGSQLQFFDKQNYFLQQQGCLTGNLFNVNFINQFNIRYSNLSYEEDSLFSLQFDYYILKFQYLFPQIKIQKININDQKQKEQNFIVYTKQYNKDSICITLQEYDRCWKALDYLTHVINFYLNLPQDTITIHYIKDTFHYNFKYLVNWIKKLISLILLKSSILISQMFIINIRVY